MTTSEPTHDCPGGCGTPVGREKLACREDWYRLPKDIREAVSSAWVRKDTRAHRIAMRRAIDWYREHPRSAGGPQQTRRTEPGAVLFMAPPAPKEQP